MLVGDAATSTWRENSKGQRIQALLGSTETIADLPHAQVVAQPAAVVQQPHFHEIDQYQVIVGGSGHIGRDAVEVGQYHYTDRATTYGPIVGDEDGVCYLVLRPRGEDGVDIRAKNMPESRSIRSRRPGRHLFGDTRAAETAVWLTASDNGDGAVVTSVRIGLDASMPEPTERQASGPGYVVVLDGEVDVAGERLVATSVIWLETSDRWPDITCCTDGVIGWFSFARESGPVRPHRTVVSVQADGSN